MRVLKVVLGTLAVFAVGTLLARGTLTTAAVPSAFTTVAAAEVFDFVWSTVGEYYYDPKFHDVDWVQVGNRYRARLKDVRTQTELYLVLNAMLAELRDSHTRVLTPVQRSRREAGESLSTGLLLYEVEGVPVVYDVTANSPASEAGIVRGLRVVAVGDESIADALARTQREVGASSSQRAEKILAYLALVRSEAGHPLHLKLSDRRGFSHDYVLMPRVKSRSPKFTTRRLPGGVGYLQWDRFADPVAELVHNALLQFRDAPGVILDLRGNGGGDGKEGLRAIAPLLDKSVLVARLGTRTGKPPSAFFGLVTLPLEMRAGAEEAQIFSGRVVILVDEGTASTAEVITASLQEIGRVTVVGRTSCGCALGVLHHRKLPDGGDLAISEVSLVAGSGRRIEGGGVTPNIVVPLTLDDFDAGHDRTLAVAQALFMNQTTVAQ